MEKSEGDTQNICIIGAGIIGSYCALHILRLMPDANVTIVDSKAFTYDGASCGNLGGFATCEVQPRTTLGNLFKVPVWLLNPLGPLALRPSYLPGLLPWLWAFIKATFTPGHYAHAVENQQKLMAVAYQSHMDALGPIGLDTLISKEGTICLYKSLASLERDWRTRWALFQKQGQSCKRLTPEELEQLLPDLNPSIRHAILVPSIYHWTDPAALLKGLHNHLQGQGVKFVCENAKEICQKNGHESGVSTEAGQYVPCDKVVVAVGAWSKSLCLQLGDYVPLDTERGYNTSLTGAGIHLNNLLLCVDDDFVATPMDTGVRLGGTVELAGLNAPPNYRRTDLMARQVKDYFPEINTDNRDVWLGFRPSVPDYLPVIGPSSKHDNIYYAFGHGHVGMTQSAITGKLIAQLIQGVSPDIDTAAFSIGRFS